MSILNDFTALMSDIRSYQKDLAAMYEKITHPEEKAMMGKLIDEMEQARQKAVVVVPESIQQIEESIQRSAAQVKEQEELVEQRKKQLAAALAVAKVPPVPKPKPEVRVDPKLGPDLRSELLHRFGQHDDSANRSTVIKEAWEDWQ